MRDPGRVAPFLGKLLLLWQRYPDMRFGQMVVNVFTVQGQDADGPDLFHIEDWQIERRLDLYLSDVGGVAVEPQGITEPPEQSET
jgi:hypothetical protein